MSDMKELRLEWKQGFDSDWIARIVEQPDDIPRGSGFVAKFGDVTIYSHGWPAWSHRSSALNICGDIYDSDGDAFVVPGADRAAIEAAVAAFNKSRRPNRKWTGWLLRYADGSMTLHIVCPPRYVSSMPAIRVEIDEQGNLSGGPDVG